MVCPDNPATHSLSHNISELSPSSSQAPHRISVVCAVLRSEAKVSAAGGSSLRASFLPCFGSVHFESTGTRARGAIIRGEGVWRSLAAAALLEEEISGCAEPCSFLTAATVDSVEALSTALEPDLFLTPVRVASIVNFKVARKPTSIETALKSCAEELGGEFPRVQCHNPQLFYTCK